MSTKAEEIKKEIAAIKKQLQKPGITPALEKAYKASLSGAEDALAKEESKPEPKDESKKDKAPKKKREPKAPKSKEAQNIEDGLPETVTVTAYGETRTFNLNDCVDNLTAMKYSQQRDKESSAKTKSRMPVTAASTSIESAANHIVDMIPAKHDPAKVVAALKKFETHINQAMSDLKGAGVSQANIEKLKAAWDAIEDEIKEKQKEVKASK